MWSDSEDAQVTKTLSLLVRNVRCDRDQTEKQVSQQSSGVARWRGVGGCVTRGKAVSLTARTESQRSNLREGSRCHGGKLELEENVNGPSSIRGPYGKRRKHK